MTSTAMTRTTPAITLSAAPGTDVWRKPPSTDVFNAPTQFSSPPKPLSTFVSARVSFSAPYVHLYDQAGLLLVFTPPASPSAATAQKKWVKTGIELFDGLPRVSTVACDRWADWSLAPLSPAPRSDESDGKVTVHVERHASSGDSGASLMISRVRTGEQGEEIKEPLREVCWVFADEEEWNVQIGAYVCRPAKDVEGDLDAQFEDLTLEWK